MIPAMLHESGVRARLNIEHVTSIGDINDFIQQCIISEEAIRVKSSRLGRMIRSCSTDIMYL